MQIAIKNPTNEPRNTFVSIPWLRVAKDETPPDAEVVVTYNERRLRKVQVDRITTDPKRDDKRLWELLVHVDYMQPGGFQTAMPVYLDVSIGTGKAAPHVSQLPRVEVANNRKSVTLIGERLVAFLVLPAGPAQYDYYGGAFTSIRLTGREILDAFGAEEHPSLGHDAEKRLQLDSVSLPNDPLADEPSTSFSLFNRDWKYISSGDGPARAWVAIESPPIIYPNESKPTFEAYLYRVISLFTGADYLVEDVFVVGAPVGNRNARRQISFAPHFFLKMNFDTPPTMTITRVPHIPDWFTIATHRPPQQSYGFAATVPSGRIDNPPRDYPREKKHSVFGWELGFSNRKIRCMHLFQRRIPPNTAADETGRLWFNLIYKPPEI